MNYIKIIYISSIMLNLKSPFNHLIQLIKIYIAEKLACQITNWQTDILRLIKETLRSRKNHPVFLISNFLAIESVVFKYYDLNKPQDKFQVTSRFTAITPMLFSVSKKFITYYIIEYMFVYTHKVTLNIQFKDESVFCIIICTRTNMMF